MLNKETSQRSNILKLGLVLPLLGLFMYSFNVKEVIEYREVKGNSDHALEAGSHEMRKETDIAFAKAKKHQTHTLKASMTDDQIEALIAALENDAKNLKIKFTHRNRDANGSLVSIMIETKYPSQSSYYKNVTYENEDMQTLPDIYFSIVEGNHLQFKDFEKTMIFKTSLKGVQAELLEKVVGKNTLSNSATVKEIEKTQKVPNTVMPAIIEFVSPAANEKKERLNIRLEKPKSEQETPIATKISHELTRGINEEVEKWKTVPLDQSEIRTKIDKNTTDKELNELKEVLKRDHDIDLSYSLRRNDAREITSIQISYTSEGKNGNYSISGDSPIDEFFFFLNDKGETGFWSERSRQRMKQRKARKEQQTAQMQERREEMEVRREEMGARMEEMESRREEMEARREEHMEEMKARREEMRSNMDERSKEMKEEFKARKREMKARHKEMKEKLKDSKKDGYSTHFNFLSDDSDKEPLYYLNGKKVSKDQIKDLTPDEIESVNILKGKAAIDGYGTEAKNGVVVIKLKN